MIPLPFAQNKTFAVFGLARSGMAAARALNAAGAKVFLGDDNKARVGDAAAQGYLVRDLVQDFPNAADWLILSPGIPLTHPAPHPIVLAARSAGAEIIGDTDLFARAIANHRGTASGPKIIAVTGTNGKSTTTALIGHILGDLGAPCAIGGNIGRAVFDLPLLDQHGAYSIEMSSYQIDLSPAFAADVACLLNITPDHLDRHGSVDHYAEVKAQLLDQVRPGGTLIIGIDTPHSAKIADRFIAQGRNVVNISVERALDCGLFVDGDFLIDNRSGDPEKVLDLTALDCLPGRHNAQNIAAAYAAVRALGFDKSAIVDAISRFDGLAHRLEFLGLHKGVRIINDSKATNADSTEKALLSFDHIHWIAGGVAKAGGIESLKPLFGRIAQAYLIGQAAPAFAETLAGHVPHQSYDTLALAFESALAKALPGEVILLSPAAASFDQFADFEARGDAFRALVRGVLS
jgi:UDP-N-acetylmuramoylalanine--D-glutamate ligase